MLKAQLTRMHLVLQRSPLRMGITCFYLTFDRKKGSKNKKKQSGRPPASVFNIHSENPKLDAGDQLQRDQC